MAYEMRPDTGSLFRNDKKESDTHADYKGAALINGVEHWVDAWINTSNSGTKYMALKFKPKDARAPSHSTSSSAMMVQTNPADLGDDIPF
jgi:uncharacterized protein (DUF736 family)